MTSTFPTHSMEKSTPPLVISANTSWMGLLWSLGFTKSVAPNTSAFSAFSGLTSTAIILLAPAALQPMTAARPTAPKPNTAHVEPGSTWSERVSASLQAKTYWHIYESKVFWGIQTLLFGTNDSSSLLQNHPESYTLWEHPQSKMLPSKCLIVGMLLPSYSVVKSFVYLFVYSDFTSCGLRAFQVLFGKFPAGCHVCFIEKRLLSNHCTIKTWSMKSHTTGYPSVRYSHLYWWVHKACHTPVR